MVLTALFLAITLSRHWLKRNFIHLRHSLCKWPHIRSSATCLVSPVSYSTMKFSKPYANSVAPWILGMKNLGSYSLIFIISIGLHASLNQRCIAFLTILLLLLRRTLLNLCTAPYWFTNPVVTYCMCPRTNRLFSQIIFYRVSSKDLVASNLTCILWSESVCHFLPSVVSISCLYLNSKSLNFWATSSLSNLTLSISFSVFMISASVYRKMSSDYLIISSSATSLTF